MTERRRGAELERALLDAAWEELQICGFDALTMDAVATRAGTSRTVLYRRWKDKTELVRDTLAEVLKNRQPVDPDTGTLRGDLLALLTALPERRDRAFAALSVQLRDYYDSTGTTPAQLREYISGEDPTLVETVYHRAVARGEIAPAKLTERIKRLPFVVMRDEMMRQRATSYARTAARVAEEIVDTIVLPLIAPRTGTGPSPCD